MGCPYKNLCYLVTQDPVVLFGNSVGAPSYNGSAMIRAGGPATSFELAGACRIRHNTRPKWISNKLS